MNELQRKTRPLARLFILALLFLAVLLCYAPPRPGGETLARNPSTRAAPPNDASGARDQMEQDTVRFPSVAGQFYPRNTAELSAAVELYLSSAADPALPGPVRALIVPHAGYVYSGPIAASGYRAVGKCCRQVIILASNHSRVARPFRFALPSAQIFETPLGRVHVSEAAKHLLKDSGMFSVVDEAHASHVIEVQLPFLQKTLGNFEILPVVVGWVDAAALQHAAAALIRLLDDETLLVVSSDLSHYHPYEEAVELDRRCVRAFESLDMQSAANCEACGLDAALIAMDIARRAGWKGKALDYRNSGDTAGSKQQVVGYTAVAFYSPD